MGIFRKDLFWAYFDRPDSNLNLVFSKKFAFLSYKFSVFACLQLYMDTMFAFVGLKIRPSHFLKYIEYLIKFVVHEGKANEPIAEFIHGIKDLPEWTFGAQEEVR